MVKEVDVTYRFPKAQEAALWLPIFDERGRTSYYLSCSSPSGWVPEFPIERYSYDPSGDFDCHLESALDAECAIGPLFRDRTLAGEKDWSTRSRFFAREVTGACASYPDYGRRREFELRGMTVQLEMDHVSLMNAPRGARGPLLASFDFRVRVNRNPLAHKPTAAKSKYKAPGSFALGEKSQSPSCDRPELTTE